MASHVSAIAPADLEQRLRDLAERADAHGVHQHFEDIAVGDHGVAQTLEHRWRILGVALLKFREALELRLLFVSVERASSISCCSSSPFGLRNVLTPMIGSEPSCFLCS